MNFRKKIYLLSIVAVLAYVYIALQEITGMINSINEYSEIKAAINSIKRLSETIHEIQKERGKSTAILTGNLKYLDLTEQRSICDKKIAELTTLSPSDKDKTISEINSVRASVDSRNISLVDSNERYSRIILRLIDEVSNISIKSKYYDIADQLAAYLHLLKAKEFLGQIRAMLNGYFASDRPENYRLDGLPSLKAFYEVNTGIFLQQAAYNITTFYHSRFQGKDVDATLEMIDNALGILHRGGFRGNQRIWWHAATVSINILEEIEDYCFVSMTEIVAGQLNKAQRNGVLRLALVLLLSFVISVVAFKTSRDVIEKTNKLLEGMIDVMDTGDYSKRINVSSGDEIDSVAIRFNDLLDTTAQLIKEKEILAATDPLTKIYNRLKFGEIFNLEIERAKRYKSPLSLISFDIDHFKKVNDTYGHQAGDCVLKNTTRIVTENVRDTDIFARLGGEEFGILTPSTDMQEARELAERLRIAIEAAFNEDIGNITCSFGVAEYTEGDDMQSLYNRADKALYKAKQLGRNRVCIETGSN